MMTSLSIEAIRKEVLRMDPTLSPDEDAFNAAVAMLSAVAHNNHDIVATAAFTGLPRHMVSRWFTSLRRSRVFLGPARNPTFAIAAWLDENGALAFWMDVNVALGYLDRTEA